MAWVWGLTITAALLETAGIGLSVKEYLDARERWRNLLPEPEPAPRGGGLRIRGGAATVSWNPEKPRDIQKHVDALERRLTWEMRTRRHKDERIRASVPKIADEAAAKVEARLVPSIDALLGHVSGQYVERPRWLPFWWVGPALLAAGVVVGLVANLVAITVAR